MRFLCLIYNQPKIFANVIKCNNNINFSGIGLLASFLSFEARKRISAREAMRNPYFENLGSGVALLKDSEYRNMLLDQTPFSIHALKSDCAKVHRYSDGVYIHVSPVWSGVNLLFLLSLSLCPYSSPKGFSNKITPLEVKYVYPCNAVYLSCPPQQIILTFC